MSKSRDIDIRVHIENPVEQVFKAWLTADLLERWLTRKANVQPFVGGAYELFWEPERPDHNSTKGCRIIDLVPNAELSFNWRGPDEFDELMGDTTQVSLRFTAQEGGTLLHFIHSGWGKGAQWDKARSRQAESWKSAIENLKNMLENTDRFLQNVSMN